MTRSSTDVRGAFWAVAAYGWWGLAPIYFKLVGHVPPLEILAHRVVWSFLFLALLLSLLGRWRSVALRHRPTLLLLTATSVLVAINWFVFIWAVTHDQILQASLGYFINPLVSVLLGFVVLREHLARIEWVAVTLAAIAVTWLTLAAGVLPWISLVLAGSFGLYGLLRKIAQIESLEGLTIETAVLLPVALTYLVVLRTHDELAFAAVSRATDLLLIAAGVMTATPLLWFAIAVRRLRLVTIGILQFIAPTGHFLLAVVFYEEPFDRERLLAFVLIWIALALYSSHLIRRGWTSRRLRPLTAIPPTVALLESSIEEPEGEPDTT